MTFHDPCRTLCRRVLEAALILFALSLTVQSSGGEAQYRGGAGRANYHPGALGDRQPAPTTGPVVLLVEARPLALTYSDGTRLELPVESRLIALETAGGRPLWTASLPAPVYRDFTIAGGVLYYYSWDQYYNACDARTGALLWRRREDGPLGSPAVVVSDGVVHTGALALSAETGRELWRRGDARNLFLAPAVREARLFGGGRAVSALLGEDVWTSPEPDEAVAPALLAGEVLVTAGRDQRLYAFDAGSGERLWALDVGAFIFSPAAEGGRVFVAARDRNLRALDARSGAEQWSVTTPGGFDGPPVAEGGRVFCRTRERYLFALDAASGAELWKTRLDDEGPLPVEPASGGGVLIVVTGRRVRCFEAASGAQLWERTFERPVDWAGPLLTDPRRIPADPLKLRLQTPGP
ncbi:MAG: hypothetical protein Kow0059_05170 [Candidatus Sumerlaeia bacterium]